MSAATLWETTVEVGIVGWRNLLGLLVVTLSVWVAFVPLVAMILIGTPVAIIGGLWTTCLLLGIALLVVFGFTSRAVDRGVGVTVWPSFRAVWRRTRVGMTLGGATFGVVVASLAVIGVSPVPYRAIAVGVAGFLLVFWYVLIGLASPELGAGSALRPAVRAAAVRFARSPTTTGWFLGLSLVASVVAGVTLVTVFLFLPGVLGLIAMGTATRVATVDELASTETGSDGE